MPRFVTASKTHQDRVHFLGVDTRDDPQAAARFIQQYSIPFPSLGDPKGDILIANKGIGLPMTLFYRDDGELAFKEQGEVDAEKLEDRIAELLRVARTPDAGSGATAVPRE